MKLPRRQARTIPMLFAVLAFGCSTVAALPARAAEEAQQAPGVARLRNLDGAVDVRRGDANDTFAAALNAPVGVGDYLTTQQRSRAEIEFDYASLMRVAPDSQLRFVKLDPHAHEVQLAEGTVELRVFRGLDAHPVVDTPEVTVRPLERGRYRVTVTHDGNTEVTVRSGRADVVVGDNVTQRTLEPGATFVVTGDGGDVRSRTIDTVAFDDFDQWTDGLDGRFANVGDWTYEDRGIVGADDLDGYGTWVDSADYGQAWQPQEPAGWSPYSDGRWVWAAYYGWTWVGNEPWGYAPYHYGRWFYANDAWAWSPGAYEVDQPYAYAPALVGFFGFGDGEGIGWTPLAPFEAYHPWWGDGAYGRGSTTVINNYYGDGSRGNGYGYGYGGNAGRPYRNTTAPGGAMGVSGTNFAGGHFNNIAPLSPPSLHDITALRGVLPVVPTVANLGFTGGAARTTNDVAPLSPRFDRLEPVRVHQATFDEQRAAVESAAAERAGGNGGSAWSRFNGISSTPQVTHPYAAPQRTTDDAPRTYAQPERIYREPAHTSSAPARSYSEEPRSYSAPSHASESAPRTTHAAENAHRSSGNGGHGSSKHDRKDR